MENLDNQLENQIRTFIVEECGCKISELSSNYSLLHDLGIDGDDAYDLLILFSKRFQVDLSNLDFNLHFGPEAGWNPLLYFYWRIFEPNVLKKIPITINDLINSAKEKRWIKPEAEPQL